MQHSHRRVWIVFAGLALVGLAVVEVWLSSRASLALAQELPAAALRPQQEDAELNDVCFVSPTTGWAVGALGVIWHTSDAGRSWRLQASGVTCRLESVSFLDERRGWAVGGEAWPYTSLTRGVMLRTRDGGETWQQDLVSMLPALKYVTFFDPERAVIAGASSALFPTGVAFTNTGGRNWDPATGDSVQGWQAADFLGPSSGSVLATHGSLALARGRALESVELPELRPGAVGAVRFAGPAHGWLVGADAQVYHSADQGRTWQPPPSDPRSVAGANFDGRGIAARGASVWVVGAPGARVLHSSNAGESWQMLATGQTAPLRAVTFVDDRQGWAVGALGTVLATTDAGRTWTRQRAGTTRASVLALLAEPATAPVELFARLAGQEGYITACELFCRRDLEPGTPSAAEVLDRAQQALAAVGVSAVEMTQAFPVWQQGSRPTSEQIVAGWNELHEGRALERLEALIAQRIRTWRPELIVAPAVTARGEDPVGQLINQAVLRAFEAAGDPARFPEQIVHQGLEPWRAKRVVGFVPGGQLGSLNVSTGQLAPRLGGSLADVGDRARGLLLPRPTAAPTALGFQVCIDQVPNSGANGDFLSGVVLFPGSEARRYLADVEGSPDALRRMVQKSRNLQAALTRRGRLPGDRAGLMAQAVELTSGLDETAAGEILFHVSRQYAADGRWDAAAEMATSLVTRHPRHRLTPATLVWLMHYWSSGEVAAVIESREKLAAAPLLPALGIDAPKTVMPATATAPVDASLGASLGPAARLQGSRIEAHLTDTPGLTQRAARAAEVAQHLERLYPALYHEPIVQVPWTAIQRRQGQPQANERYLGPFSRTRGHDAWWACAAGELWQQEPKGPPPKPVHNVNRTAARPRLDGQLDDSVWQTARSVPLISALADDDTWPATVRWAYDEGFLYVAVRCQTTAPLAEPPASPRPRDPDLAAFDRVELLIDTDRDYATWYKLAIDARGWVAEDCWGDVTWNPTWYVGSARSAGVWTAEAAIPWSSLVGKPPTARAVWAVGAQRIAPGLGFQSSTTPATIHGVGEGFGYLRFD